jgi:hypothetical protein
MGLIIRTLCELSCQAGVIDEMMEDMLDSQEDDEIEQEADAEVDKILFDLTNGKLGQAGAVQTELPVCHLSLRLFSAHFCLHSLRRSSWKTRRQSVRWNGTASS